VQLNQIVILLPSEHSAKINIITIEIETKLRGRR